MDFRMKKLLSALAALAFLFGGFLSLGSDAFAGDQLPNNQDFPILDNDGNYRGVADTYDEGDGMTYIPDGGTPQTWDWDEEQGGYTSPSAPGVLWEFFKDTGASAPGSSSPSGGIAGTWELSSISTGALISSGTYKDGRGILVPDPT